MVGIGILGFGTVGGGVFEVIKKSNAILKNRTGKEIKILGVLDLKEFPNDEVNSVLTKNFQDIINNDKIEIVAEVMGGVEPAYSFTKACLEAKKSVVTSNKAVVAEHGIELLELARKNNVSYLFEASVGGGIPIIRPLNDCLVSDDILEISGILNGTTNFILTKMTEEGKDFAEVLKEAQNLGYAEADPTADVEGHDACRKIAILSSLAWGKTVDYNDIHTDGISKISSIDIEYAKALNGVIKLLGISKKTSAGISAKVAPFIIKNEHRLSFVKEAYNAILVDGDMSGKTMYYGSGAGKLPTASAVVSDIVDAIMHKGKTVNINWISGEKEVVIPNNSSKVSALIRINYKDKAAAKNELTNIFANYKFIQLENTQNEFGIIVENETEGSLKEKLELMTFGEVINFIRMEG